MRPRLLGVAAAVMSLLAVSVPAHADTTTTIEITDVVAVDMSAVGPAYRSLLDPGPVTLPASLTVVLADGFRASGFRPVPPAAGCTRLINSVTLDFSATWTDGFSSIQAGQLTAAGAFAPDAVVTYAGSGTQIGPADTAVVVAQMSGPSGAGTVTVTYPSPIPHDEGLFFAGFFTSDVTSDWTISAIRFAVTDTCGEATPAATLPSMGQDARAAGIAALILLGAGAMALLAARHARRVP